MSSAVAPSAAGKAVLSPPKPAELGRVRSRRPLRTAVVTITILTAMILGAWAVVNFTRKSRAVAETARFTVAPRDFNVVLKEKGELKAAKSTDIICEIEGRTRIISLIPEGTQVKEGDLLIVLASDQIEDKIRQEELKETNLLTTFEAARTELEIQRDKNLSDIRKAELEIELARLALERYEKGDWEQQLKDANIAIEQARIALQRRQEDFEASKKLREKNYITLTEYEEDSFNYQKAVWDLEKAEKSLEVLNTYTHTVELRKRQADLDEAEKEAERVRKNAAAEEIKKLRAVEGAEKELGITRDQLAKLRSQKEKCRITAPTKGFVVYFGGGGGGAFRMMSGDSQIREGAEVFERQILMQLPDTSSMLAVVRIHEAKTDKLRVGQHVIVEVEGVPGKQFPGTVTKIAAIADTQNRWLNPDLKEYETEITLDPTDVPLKPGVTAHAEVFVEAVEDKLAVPVQSVFSKGGRRFVFKEAGREVVPAEVRLGSVGMEWVEVTSGLSGGERILLAATEDHKRLLPEGGPGERMPDMMRAGRPMRNAARPAGGEAVPSDAEGAKPVMIQSNGGIPPGVQVRPVAGDGQSPSSVQVARPEGERGNRNDGGSAKDPAARPVRENPDQKKEPSTPPQSSPPSGSSGR
jgi:HlyD family secretion protein